MKISRLRLYACAAALMFAGCGGSRLPAGAPGAMPQSRGALGTANGESWMLPQAKYKDLLYVADGYYSVSVYSYPDGTLVGQLGNLYYPWAVCTDTKGHVFIGREYPSEIEEFKHGGTEPIATLQDGTQDQSFVPYNCAVDRVSGDLAVANSYGGSSDQYSGNVALYQHASGAPQMISGHIRYVSSAVFDDKGNLYVDGSGYNRRLRFETVKHGTAAPRSFKVNYDFGYSGAGPLAWSKGRLVIAVGSAAYQFDVKRRLGRLAGTVPLDGPSLGYHMTIKGNTLIAAGWNTAAVYLYHYPEGGNPFASITTSIATPAGVAVSSVR